MLETAYPEINALFVRIIRKTGVRPPYLWGSLHGAYLARALGIGAVSLIEFGVAGGNGLVDLDQIGQALEVCLGVRVAVYGFDTGRGLPAPVDVRDCPNLFSGGDYPMDVERLQARLQRSELVLGDVADTVTPFLAGRPAPVAFISFDLDLYSATTEALRVLEGDAVGFFLVSTVTSMTSRAIPTANSTESAWRFGSSTSGMSCEKSLQSTP